jgi:hypothetical protein
MFAQIPHFDVLSMDPETSVRKIKERLEDNNFKGVVVTKHSGIGEIVPEHYEIAVGKTQVAFIYKPVACHSYNVIQVGKKRVRIASTDTMLSLYLAMLYTDKPYYDVARIRCMCKYLYDIQQRNRLKQTGLLRRFGATCYGKQETLDDIKAKKSEKYQELKREDPEYDEWFLKYSPMEYFDHTYDAKTHKLTVKRSPNASPTHKTPKNHAPTGMSPNASKGPKSPRSFPTPTSPIAIADTKKTKRKKNRKTKKTNTLKQIFKLIT